MVSAAALASSRWCTHCLTWRLTLSCLVSHCLSLCGRGGNSSASSESHPADGDHQVVEEDPDSHEHADFAAPEVDANGAHYTDEAKSLEVGRQGVLPSLVHHSWGAWTEDDLTGLQLRGAGYLQDHVKIACGPPLFRLAHIDIFHTLKEEDKILHIAQRDDQWVKIMTNKRKKALEKVRRLQ
jgi:hypothetical protein